jgi:hypothetical protein
MRPKGNAPILADAAIIPIILTEGHQFPRHPHSPRPVRDLSQPYVPSTRIRCECRKRAHQPRPKRKNESFHPAGLDFSLNLDKFDPAPIEILIHFKYDPRAAIDAIPSPLHQSLSVI